MNTNADAISRIEINTIEQAETESLVVNLDHSQLTQSHFDDIDRIINQPAPPEQLLPIIEEIGALQTPQHLVAPKIIIHENLQIRPPDKSPPGSDTVSSAVEDPILELPDTERPLNLYQNQIILNKSPTKTLQIHFEKIFNKERISDQ
ncbi:hypothetical protein Trydic_g17612 [Trypoxylus dichotomus]